MTLTMFDSTNVADIPSTGMDAVAGYVGGSWTTWPALVKRFPHLPALSIAVNSSEDARCLDVETGDATPADVPAWLDRQTRLRPGEIPVIYCPASSIAAVRHYAGSRKYLLWSAHYGAGEHICGSCGYPGADATQFDDHGAHGEHIDRTVMSPAFFAAFAPKVPAASSIPAIFRKIVSIVRPVNHNTGLATEKPWGAFPLPATDWYGLNDGTAHSHSGLNPADARAIKQIQREVGVTADGKFGPATARAVVSWQRAHGLTGDGAVGVHTWNAMTTN